MRHLTGSAPTPRAVTGTWPARPPRRAFTLIELLVVVAIMAILAAILFPVFARVRESGKQASCLSNTRQIGMGFLQYFQDHDDRFPYTKGDTPWPHTLQPYMASYEILRCPSDDSVNWNRPLPGASVVRVTSYSLNGYLPPSVPTASNPNPAPNPYNVLSAIRSPANVIFLAENERNRTGNYFHAHVWNPPTSASHWLADRDLPDDITTDRHNEGFNVTYLDGHSRHVRWRDVWWRDHSVDPPMKGSFDPRQR